MLIIKLQSGTKSISWQSTLLYQLWGVSKEKFPRKHIRPPPCPPPRDPSQCSSYSISPLGLHGLHKPLCNVFFLCQVNEDSFLSIHDLPEDTSGEYYVHKNFIRSQSAYSSREIVLASHCTGDHLHHLVSLTEVWQGPLSIGLYNFSWNHQWIRHPACSNSQSIYWTTGLQNSCHQIYDSSQFIKLNFSNTFIAVFVPGYNLENTLSTLYILYGCFIKVLRQVTIHLVHPISVVLNDSDLMFLIRKSEEVHTKCSKALKEIKNTNKNVGINYDRKVVY